MPISEAVLLALAELREEVAALRVEMRALRRQQAEPALLSALEEEFDAGRFTAKGLLQIADEQPHSAIAEAIGSLIDMNATPHARATALGARLRRMAGIEEAARAHGSVIYRLACSIEPNLPNQPTRED